MKNRTFGLSLLLVSFSTFYISLYSVTAVSAQRPQSEKATLLMQFNDKRRSAPEEAHRIAEDYLKKFGKELDEDTQYIREWVVAYAAVRGSGGEPPSQSIIGVARPPSAVDLVNTTWQMSGGEEGKRWAEIFTFRAGGRFQWESYFADGRTRILAGTWRRVGADIFASLLDADGNPTASLQGALKGKVLAGLVKRAGIDILKFRMQSEDVVGSESGPEVSPLAELEMWNKVKLSTNANDYYGFLQKYPAGAFADQARDKMNEIGEPNWNLIRNSTDVYKFRNFIKNNPKSPFLDEAKARYEQLEADEVEWNLVGEPASEQGLSDYLSRFPKGTHSTEAKKKLSDMVWARLGSTASADEYVAFIKKYPESTHVPLARLKGLESRGLFVLHAHKGWGGRNPGYWGASLGRLSLKDRGLRFSEVQAEVIDKKSVRLPNLDSIFGYGIEPPSVKHERVFPCSDITTIEITYSAAETLLFVIHYSGGKESYYLSPKTSTHAERNAREAEQMKQAIATYCNQRGEVSVTNQPPPAEVKTSPSTDERLSAEGKTSSSTDERLDGAKTSPSTGERLPSNAIRVHHFHGRRYRPGVLEFLNKKIKYTEDPVPSEPQLVAHNFDIPCSELKTGEWSKGLMPSSSSFIFKFNNGRDAQSMLPDENSEAAKRFIGLIQRECSLQVQPEVAAAEQLEVKREPDSIVALHDHGGMIKFSISFGRLTFRDGVLTFREELRQGYKEPKPDHNFSLPCASIRDINKTYFGRIRSKEGKEHLVFVDESSDRSKAFFSTVIQSCNLPVEN